MTTTEQWIVRWTGKSRDEMKHNETAYSTREIAVHALRDLARQAELNSGPSFDSGTTTISVSIFKRMQTDSDPCEEWTAKEC